MELTSAGRMDPGKVRPDNDNAFYTSPRHDVLAVCNGNSGAKGLVASNMVLDQVRAAEPALRQASLVSDPKERRNQLLALLRDIFNDASKAIFDRARKEKGLDGMSASAAVVFLCGESAAVGHVGHNTIYHVRGDRTQRLNVYHTIAEEMLRKGQLKAVTPGQTEYTYILSRAVGMLPSTQADTLWLDLAAGDALVVCTKGITQHVEAEEIGRLVASAPATEAVDKLIALANERGGQDNLCVVISRLGEPPAPKPAAAPARPRLKLDSQSQIAALKKIPLFQYLSFEEMLTLLKIVYERQFDPGQTIVAEGSDGAELYIVCEGEVDVESRGVPLTRLKPGTPFGELSFVDGGKRSATVRAGGSAPASILTIGRDDLNTILAKDDPKVAAKLFWSICQNVAHRLRQLTDDFVGVSQQKKT